MEIHKSLIEDRIRKMDIYYDKKRNYFEYLGFYKTLKDEKLFNFYRKVKSIEIC